MSTRVTRAGVGAALLAAAVPLAGCLGAEDDNSEPNDPAALAGRTFVDAAFFENGDLLPQVPDSEVTVTFQQPREKEFLLWETGCNGFGARGELADDRLVVDDVGMTLVRCPRPLARLESRLLRFFESNPEWDLTAEELVLSSGELAIRFPAEQPDLPTVQNPGILDGSYRSTSVTDDGEPRALVAGTRIRLIFEGEAEDRSLRWTAGCNRYGASLDVTGETLNLEGIGGSESGCPDDLATQDSWLVDFFEADPEWQLAEDELTLTSGTTVIVFARDSEDAKRLEAVRRSPPGLGRQPPSARELAVAKRIMDANAYLARITDDGGGSRIIRAGIVNAAGPDRILGLIVDLRLERAVDAIYELPVVCHGVAGPPFAVPPTPYSLERVSRLLVTVTFADGRVAGIEPRNGASLPEPGAAYMSAPSTCERRATRDLEY